MPPSSEHQAVAVGSSTVNPIETDFDGTTPDGTPVSVTAGAVVSTVKTRSPSGRCCRAGRRRAARWCARRRPAR